MGKATVYFTKEITPESLIKIYKALGKNLNGKVGVKISTGEPGGNNYLHPELIGDLVRQLDGTIIECCTAYGGQRQDPKLHWKAIEDHGFPAIAPCDIMDEFGEMDLPVENGFHLDKDIVGDHFLESMADACKAVIAYKGAENMLYINVASRLSVDCDCDSHPAEPEMADLGIFASVDPVAVDQACYDAVVNSDDPGKKALIERMDSRHGIHTVEAASQYGLGSREYQIVSLDESVPVKLKSGGDYDE